ncbi:hypothetical protein PMKS-002705 [Pichia membranifaciens]|uniref:Zn(2)-C6 fungal-type domain-containing protein n=1 Tax=Pichia membranifaciens TaxID=4926 RepID=A0A1Q2YIM5_9ASCO|nr:hypothetical protein PMKS-002705 [Pichia membranifaciens]
MNTASEDPGKSRLKHHKVLPNVHPTNSLILPDGKIFKVQKKRQRKIHSCIPCHQRKIRCSRENPTCLNCLKLAEKNPSEKYEILDACKYFDNDKKKNLKKKGVSFGTSSEATTAAAAVAASSSRRSRRTAGHPSGAGHVSNDTEELEYEKLSEEEEAEELETNDENDEAEDRDDEEYQQSVKNNNSRSRSSNSSTTSQPDAFSSILVTQPFYENDYARQFERARPSHASAPKTGADSKAHSNTTNATATNVTNTIGVSTDSKTRSKKKNKKNNITNNNHNAANAKYTINPAQRNGDNEKYNLVEDNLNGKLGNTTEYNNDFPIDQNEFVYIPRDESSEHMNDSERNGFCYQNSNNVYPDDQIYSHYSKQFASQFITMLNNLPTRERSDELLKNFQTNVHSLLPILDMDGFLEKYDEFWYCGLFLTDNIEKLYQYTIYFKDKYPSVIPGKINDFLYWYNKTSGSLNPSNFSEFLILLYAVYYTSISSSVYEFLSKKYDNFNNILSYKNEVNKYYNMFKNMNHKGLNNPRVMSLAVLQINVLVQSITNLKSGKSLINISKILRICQFYQLNRDPVLYHALKDKELVQTRRIVWWQIFLLDNLVSFFLNLTPSIKLSDFDTSLLMENLDHDSCANFSIMYLNCMYRFILILDDLNGLTNGLNFQLKNEDINKMKNNINNLFITCNSTMKKMSTIFYSLHNNSEVLSTDNNSSSNPSPSNHYQHRPNSRQRQHQSPMSNSIETNPTLNSIGYNFHEPSLDTFRFFMSSLNILSDKMLIMLQKKILLSPYLIYDTYKTNSNLNLRLNSTEYSYTDLQNNLLPSLLHYLDTFLLLSKKDMLKFNWKLKNYIPIDELILLMQVLATNYKSGIFQNGYDEFSDINLKIYLIDQTINSLKLNWHLKLSSVNKLISLTSKLWELMILKFNIDLASSYSMSDKYIFPKPTHEVLSPGNYSRNINISSNSVSCAEIAPRTIGIASALDTPLRNMDSKQNGTISNDNPDQNAFNYLNLSNNEKQSYNKQKINDAIRPSCSMVDMNLNIKERFFSVAKLVEDELSKEGGSGIIQDTDDNEEGWFNLGTEEEYGFNSIDDFHFYKNLKSDVIRLFKLVVC